MMVRKEQELYLQNIKILLLKHYQESHFRLRVSRDVSRHFPISYGSEYDKKNNRGEENKPYGEAVEKAQSPNNKRDRIFRAGRVMTGNLMMAVLSRM